MPLSGGLGNAILCQLQAPHPDSWNLVAGTKAELNLSLGWLFWTYDQDPAGALSSPRLAWWLWPWDQVCLSAACRATLSVIRGYRR